MEEFQKKKFLDHFSPTFLSQKSKNFKISYIFNFVLVNDGWISHILQRMLMLQYGNSAEIRLHFAIYFKAT